MDTLYFLFAFSFSLHLKLFTSDLSNGSEWIYAVTVVSRERAPQNHLMYVCGGRATGQNSINVTFKLTLMSGLSPIHTSYLEDRTTVRQHFTCFEFTHTKNTQMAKTKKMKKNKLKCQRKSEENKWNVSHVKALSFGIGTVYIRGNVGNWIVATWKSQSKLPTTGLHRWMEKNHINVYSCGL